MALILSGTGVSKGICIGPIHILDRNQLEVSRYEVESQDISAEISRFRDAHKQTVDHLKDIRESIPSDAPEVTKAVIDTHLQMLADDLLRLVPEATIREQKCNAGWALKQQGDVLTQAFDDMEDVYLQAKRHDIQHIIHIIQSFLHNEHYNLIPDQNIKDHIIVTDDLTPADTIMLERQKVGGFITEFGGPTSHTAILARSFNIPSIVAVPNARKLLKEDEIIIIDSTKGTIVAGADQPLLTKYRKRQRIEKKHRQELEQLRDTPAKTRDGVHITLMANIELNDDIRILKRCGSDGVGLYRTEFLYIDQHRMVTEEQQILIYKKVLKATKGNPVTIRTLDLGAEKEFDPNYKGPLVLNPALGLRGIRRSLKYPKSFLEQLRAILRASAYGKIRVLIPMLTNKAELDRILDLFAIAKNQLIEKKIDFDKNIQIGGMIEIPATALAIESFGESLDFLSIGTNDLIQYALAVDRIDEEVGYLYDPLHPGILQLIKEIISAGKKLKIPVAMCGEMASDVRFTRLLLAMGLKEFSTHPNDLPTIKNIIINSNLASLKRRFKHLSESKNPQEILKLVDT